VLHASAAAVMTYGYLSLKTTVLDSWIRSQKGGHFQFLTIQGLSVAWLTMIFSLICDLFPSSTYVKRAKRSLFMISLPLSVVISATYWTLILLLPALILQSDPKNTVPSASSENIVRIPLRIDLALHAAPALTLLVDFFLFETRYSQSEATYGATAVSALFGIWYGCWVEYCASVNGSFPYPFLNNPLKIRIPIYIGAVVLAFVSFRGINALHGKDSIGPSSKAKKRV